MNVSETTKTFWENAGKVATWVQKWKSQPEKAKAVRKLLLSLLLDCIFKRFFLFFTNVKWDSNFCNFLNILKWIEVSFFSFDWPKMPFLKNLSEILKGQRLFDWTPGKWQYERKKRRVAREVGKKQRNGSVQNWWEIAREGGGKVDLTCNQ